MNEQDIRQLAERHYEDWHDSGDEYKTLPAFIALAREAVALTRTQTIEECAALCDSIERGIPDYEYAALARESMGKAIRALGGTP